MNAKKCKNCPFCALLEPNYVCSILPRREGFSSGYLTHSFLLEFLLTLTFDLKVDIPGSVACKTASHHSQFCPLLVFLVESLNWQFFITNHQGYEPGLALPAWLIADNLLFLTWILVVFRSHSPCRNCAFSSSVPEFLIKLTYFPTHVLHL